MVYFHTGWVLKLTGAQQIIAYDKCRDADPGSPTLVFRREVSLDLQQVAVKHT